MSCSTPLETGLKVDCGVSVEEMEEGKESNSFKKALGLDRAAYDSAMGGRLLKTPFSEVNICSCQ